MILEENCLSGLNIHVKPILPVIGNNMGSPARFTHKNNLLNDRQTYTGIALKLSYCACDKHREECNVNCCRRSAGPGSFTSLRRQTTGLDR